MSGPVSSLISAFALVTGLPRGSVEAQSRHLRERGLLTSTGARGPWAPDATVDDAVNLLIAILSSRNQPDGPRAVALGRRLTLDRFMDPLGREDTPEPPTSEALFGLSPSGHTFGEMLTAVVTAYVRGGGACIYAPTGQLAMVDLRMTVPGGSAFLMLRSYHRGENGWSESGWSALYTDRAEEEAHEELIERLPAAEREEAHRRYLERVAETLGPEGDLTAERGVSFYTFRTLGWFLSSGELPDDLIARREASALPAPAPLYSGAGLKERVARGRRLRARLEQRPAGVGP